MMPTRQEYPSGPPSSPTGQFATGVIPQRRPPSAALTRAQQRVQDLKDTLDKRDKEINDYLATPKATAADPNVAQLQQNRQKVYDDYIKAVDALTEAEKAEGLQIRHEAVQ